MPETAKATTPAGRQQGYIQANQKLWDELTGIHAKSKFYDVAGFKKGKSTLTPVEQQELGDVKGKSVLHLQCHFGLDTLSLARMGAKVTGVDFSEKSIALAKKLAKEAGIEARFICSDVYNLPHALALTEKFDVVFASYGVLCWLPDLKRWAKIAAQYLKPGGTLYVLDFHPFNNVFANQRDTKDFQVANSYFHSAEPVKVPWDGSYADAKAKVGNLSFEWTHTLGDILNAILGADLRVQFLHEFPFSIYAYFPFLQESPDGLWRVKGKRTVPLLFSVKATKPALAAAAAPSVHPAIAGRPRTSLKNRRR